MADVFAPDKRSAVMRAVRSRDTGPERAVRQAAHAAGYRFRLNRVDLPGKPDLVAPKWRAAVFVHGCFWHGHDCPRGARVPATRTAYWTAKIARNRTRDAQALADLAELGWRGVVIWECETRKRIELTDVIRARIGDNRLNTAYIVNEEI